MKRRIMLIAMSFVMVVGLSGCAERVSLFNGGNLDGWNTYLQNENVKACDVWSVESGVINCKGKPNGYLRTAKEYLNYKLHVEWRWVSEPTNSGILLHTKGVDKIWPLCFMVGHCFPSAEMAQVNAFGQGRPSWPERSLKW